MNHVWALAGCAAFMVACSKSEAPPPPAEPIRLEVGARFPDLVLPTLEDGRPASLRDFRGRKVILHVFASW